MTIQQAKKLKWGTVLEPSESQRRIFKQRSLQEAIFLGVSRDDWNISIVVADRRSAESWAPVFWKVKPGYPNA